MNKLSPVRKLRQSNRSSWIICWTLAAGATGWSAPPPDQVEYFEKEVRPLLASQCYGCHSSKAPTKFAGLLLDSASGIQRGSDSGPVVVAGKPDDSKLIRAVRGQTPVRMPPTGKLKDEQIAVLVRWIEMGAPYPAQDGDAAKVEAFDLQKRKREHWAWQPLKAVAPPAVHDESWSIQPSDRFVLAALQREGMQPAPQADRRIWLRRLSFDLTGLPPTSQELDVFVADKSADAYEKQVDRLLASPRFGEHWARHWMDLVRYAESHGSEGDPDAPGAWRYRDYLIRAFNDDLPYDQLIREHLAGDLLPHPRLNRADRTNESMLGAINLRMVEYGFQPLDPMEDRLKWTDNQIDVFSKTFQGLTVSCARCHDHKFDAISQKDYYSLFGIIGSIRPTEAAIDLPEDVNANRAELVRKKGEIRQELAALWKTAAKQLPEFLNSFLEARKGETEESPLQPWLALHASGVDTIQSRWTELKKHWTETIRSRTEFNQGNFHTQWDLRGPDYNPWFKRGFGMPAAPSKPGEFSILFEGDQVLNGIYPAGVYTNLLSARRSGVLQSPRFEINTDSISLKIQGRNFSFAQLVLENHAVSRGGTHFRLTVGKDELGWVRWNTSFWKGQGITAYIELATAEDASFFNPVPPPPDKKKETGEKKETAEKAAAADENKETEQKEGAKRPPKPVPPKDGRSWFGIERVLFHDNQLTPQDDVPAIGYLFEGRDPRSAEELAALYAERLGAAVDAWANGTLSESQSAFLNYFVRSGILSTSRLQSAKLAALVDSYRDLDNHVPLVRRVPSVIQEPGREQHIFIRGNHKNLGDVVSMRYLESLGGASFADAATARLDLAGFLTSPADPLTSRVMVNRIWKYLFGAGIVRTVDNFGKVGEPPSHPELLDWLANRFVAEGWSIKKMVRLLATSQAYRMSSAPSEVAVKNDPANHWLQHMPVRRLDAESIRDSMLYVSGRLNLSMYGPSISTYYAHDTGKTIGDRPKGPLDGDGRRSVYLEIRRNVTNPFLEAFDLPKPVTTRGERDQTNVPAQSLALMNDPFVIDQADTWAKAALAVKNISPAERIEQLFVRALGRAPLPQERDSAQTLLEQLKAEAPSNGQDSEVAAWSGLAHSIFDLKEFIYIR